MASQIEAGDHTGQEDQVFRLHLPAVALFYPIDDGLAQLGHLSVIVGVAKKAVFDALSQGADDRLWRAEVHICHP